MSEALASGTGHAEQRAIGGSAHPAVVLGAYAESLLRGRRVAVLGDAMLPLAEDLIERGARLVHVYDPDPGRLAVAAARRANDGAGATRSHRPVLALLGEDLGVRDGAFDVVFVPDMSLLDDAQDLIRKVRRMVAPSGIAILASPNPEAERFLLPPSGALERALGYYELYDAISLQFPEVRMLGQAPFVGYSIVDFAESDPDVSVDTSCLSEPETPEWFIAVASDRQVELEAYALVEISAEDLARAGATSSAREPVTMPRGSIAPSDGDVALTEAQTRISVLLTENEKLREQVRDAARAERAFDQISVRAAELERDADTLRQRSDRAVAELVDERARANQLAEDLVLVRADLLEEREAREALRAQADSARAEADQLKALGPELSSAKRRIIELEMKVAAIEPPTLRSKEMQQQRILALETQKAELEAREQELLARLKELEANLTRLQKERDRLSADRDAATRDRVAIARQRDEHAARLAAIDAAGGIDAALAERALASQEKQASVALEQEIASLEAALRERGQVVTRLQREARETERVGRELLFELQEVRALSLPVAPPPPAPGGTGNSGAGFDASGLGSAGLAAGKSGATGLLSSPPARADAADTNGAAVNDSERATQDAAEVAERAARAEADLLAAGWKIARLERELSRAASPAHSEPGAAVRELEIALAAAQREIALLRLAPEPPVVVGPSILENQVLLGQLERERLSEEQP